jgi:diamine N-acetyltransferase
MDAIPPKIRKAVRADEIKLAALSEHAFVSTFVDELGASYAPEDLEAFIEQAHSRAAFLKMFADPTLKVWVAESSTLQLLGYAVAGPCRLPHPEVAVGDAEIKRLYVRREAFGTGLGARLLETAIKGVDPSGARRLWLGVWSGNERAQRFYARYGFEKVGEYDYRVGATVDREFILRRG